MTDTTKAKVKKKSANTDSTETNESLEQKVLRLEEALAKIGTMTGNRAVLLEFKIEPWEPGKKDMSKYNN